MSKLTLGGAQFGQTYGIMSSGNLLDIHLAEKLLNIAKKYGINSIDTAHGYGSSEKILGAIGITDWDVTTKLPTEKKRDNKRDYLKESLERLRRDSVNSVLLHSTSDLKSSSSNMIWNKMQSYRDNGFTNKIGYSVYSPDELEHFYKRFRPDVIQCPYSVLDRRFENSGWFDVLKNNDVEIQIRSVFLQGLLLNFQNNQHKYFNKWSDLFDSWANKVNCEVSKAITYCLGIPLSNELIDKVIIGVDSIENFKEVIENAKEISERLEEFSIDDPSLLEPFRWKIK